MAKLALVYGMRLLPVEDLGEVKEATVVLTNGRTARVAMHLIEGSKEEIEKTFRESIDAFFEMYQRFRDLAWFQKGDRQSGSKKVTRGKTLAGQVDFTFLLKDISSLERSAIAEVFGVDAGIAEIVVDEHGGLAGEFETLAALVAGNEIVKANHKGSGFCELATVLLARAARQLLFLAADLPANGC